MTVSTETLLEILQESAPAGTPELRDANAPMVNLGIDSLDIANFLLAVEERYGVRITDDDMDRISTVRDVATFLNERLPG